MMSGNLRSFNPYPWFHCADCYMQLQQYEVAKIMFYRAIQEAGDSSQHEKVKQQANAYISAINEAIHKQ